MKSPIFQGACTALVTPFSNGKINLPMLHILIERQIQSGINTFVLCGTTGEAPTLSDKEKIRIFSYVKQHFPQQTIICGTGSNDTHHAVFLSQAAEDAGADALLVVSPYYNKTSSQGLADHFQAIAASVHIPIILYNVPSRTGLDMPVHIYKQLSRIPNINGVKEASGDIAKTAKILASCLSDFFIWSGNDDMTVPIMSLGGQGVISVASNVAPTQMQDMCLAALAGDFDTAAELQLSMLPLMESLFSEVNPIPVKAAMKILGYDCGECRPPLSALSKEKETALKALLS